MCQMHNTTFSWLHCVSHFTGLSEKVETVRIVGKLLVLPETSSFTLPDSDTEIRMNFISVWYLNTLPIIDTSEPITCYVRKAFKNTSTACYKLNHSIGLIYI